MIHAGQRVKSMNRYVSVLLLCAAALTGCSFLSPREDPSRFFLLTSPPTSNPGPSSDPAPGANEST